MTGREWQPFKPQDAFRNRRLSIRNRHKKAPSLIERTGLYGIAAATKAKALLDHD